MLHIGLHKGAQPLIGIVTIGIRWLVLSSDPSFALKFISDSICGFCLWLNVQAIEGKVNQEITRIPRVWTVHRMQALQLA